MDGEFGSSYVHVDDHSVGLDPELCEVDLDLFFSFVRKGEEYQKAGDPKAALTAYNQALDLYKGDFLPEEVYAPWADMKREQMRQKCVEILARVCKLYETLGAVRKAIEGYRKAIEMDPLMEEFYQKLMTLYFNRGMLNDALRVYEDCKKALRSGLKTTPDPVTTALYNKIHQKLGSI